MKRLKSFIDKYLFVIIVLVGILGVALLSLLFDFYYDLNDDVLIKDILSGLYTGVPDAHNNQLMYPLSIVYSVLYRIVPSVPWFGLSEILIFLLGFIIISRRLTILVHRTYAKVLVLIGLTILWSGCYLWELTNIQYTVVSGMLATTVAVYLYTTNSGTSVKRFLVDNIPTYLLCFVSFNLRSEMFLLMTPILAMVGIYKWSGERQIFTRDTLSKYLGVVAILIVGIAATVAIDAMAYSQQDWKVFREFFDARTRVYDITGIPEYDSNKDFYDSEDISAEQIEVLKSYNFALDESIDSKLLNSIADYVDSGVAITNRAPRGIRSAVREYIGHAIDMNNIQPNIETPFSDDAAQHSPMNLIVLALYACLLVQVIGSDHKGRGVVVFIAMIVLRSIPWVYVYTTQRVLSRISHPLYMLEMMVLLAIVLSSWSGYGRRVSQMIMVLIVVIAALQIPGEVQAVHARQNVREVRNEVAQSLYDEMAKHPDTYYYVDVYSTVSFTEKIFDRMPSKANWQLAGGWIAKSPLDESKQGAGKYSTYKFVRLSDKNEWIQEVIE